MKFLKHSVIILFALGAFIFISSRVSAAATVVPSIDVTNVIQDTSVTVHTYNFPENYTFEVKMGQIGSKAEDGIVVGQMDTGSGGEMDLSFNIPDTLKGTSQISIRMDSLNGGYYTYDWFSNGSQGSVAAVVATAVPVPDTSTGQVATAAPVTVGSTGSSTAVIPAIDIRIVDSGDDITVDGYNFPHNMDFDVLMGKMGTQGVGGIKVTYQNSGDDGEFTATYDIPDELKHEGQIAIRLESKSGYYCYDFFTNREPTKTPTPTSTDDD